MEWLRVQLKILRSRNMKAILMGHVPPATSRYWCIQSVYFCQQVSSQFFFSLDRAGGTWPMRNIDHFMLQDNNKVDIDSKAHGKVSINSKADYLEYLVVVLEHEMVDVHMTVKAPDNNITVLVHPERIFAVDGCNAKSEPGYEHMEWLRVQLKILRSRNMKANRPRRRCDADLLG
jgi:hypothetical protein